LDVYHIKRAKKHAHILAELFISKLVRLGLYHPVVSTSERMKEHMVSTTTTTTSL